MNFKKSEKNKILKNNSKKNKNCKKNDSEKIILKN